MVAFVEALHLGQLTSVGLEQSHPISELQKSQAQGRYEIPAFRKDVAGHPSRLVPSTRAGEDSNSPSTSEVNDETYTCSDLSEVYQWPDHNAAVREEPSGHNRTGSRIPPLSEEGLDLQRNTTGPASNGRVTSMTTGDVRSSAHTTRSPKLGLESSRHDQGPLPLPALRAVGSPHLPDLAGGPEPPAYDSKA